MAYTGILLRGDTFTNIYNDPPIAREAAMAGANLGFGTNTGANYWLNLAALAEIGKITDGNGTIRTGILTSTLPITFDGATGFIKEDTTAMVVKGTHNWTYAALAAFAKVDDTDFNFANTTIKTATWNHIVGAKPTIDALTTTAITVSWTLGHEVRIYNETTQTDLGSLTTTGSTLTFGSAQTSGDVITVYALDNDYNHSAKAKGVIA